MSDRNRSDRSRQYRTHGLILRRRDYRDADRILTVFTPNYGKLELIAKGVRKTTSRKAGHLELFAHCSLLVAQARTWDIITEAVTVESFSGLRMDLDKIARAGYLCELVDCFTESEDENQLLWDLLLVTLSELDVAPTDDGFFTLALLQHWFELHLLTLTGFQPQLFHCLACDEELTPVTNYINLIAGGVICPECAQSQPDMEPISPDVLKVLRFLQSRPWPAVAQVKVREHVMRQVGNLIYRYLLTVLERQLRSVDFMRRLQVLAPVPVAPVAPVAGSTPIPDAHDATPADTSHPIGP